VPDRTAIDEVLRRPAEPLGTNVRAVMESHLGHDFAQVRVHTDEKAAASARSLGVRAYTCGSHIVIGDGRFDPATRQGASLLAHELAHVIQQREGVAAPGWPSGVLRAADLEQQADQAGGRDFSRTGPHVGGRVARTGTQAGPVGILQAKDGGAASSPVDDLLLLLPEAKGTDASAVLLGVLGKEGLARIAGQIAGNGAAKKLVRDKGIPAVIALLDTAGPAGLQPAEAAKRLADPKTAQGYALTQLVPRPEKPPSYWFQDKPPARPAQAGSADIPIEEKGGAFVDPATIKVGDVPVVFAYPKPDRRGDKPSERVQQAQKLILDAIKGVMQDLGSLPYAPDEKTFRENERARARLKEAFSPSHPLNVFIATELTVSEELAASSPAPSTARIFVNPSDIGDPAKLQAAVRLPLAVLLGGARGLKGQDVPQLTAAQLKEAVLHEEVHALLINRRSSANQIFENLVKGKLVKGPPTVVERCQELVHRFLLAQEESFVYGNVGKVYSNYLQNKDVYDLWIKSAHAYLESKSAKFETQKKTLDVGEKVGKKKVAWDIRYDVPTSMTAGPTDIADLNTLLAAYPAATE
jgi:hypothetical protein